MKYFYIYKFFSGDIIIICYIVVMFLGLKHSRNYLLIYITVFIGRLLGALQKKTFDVLSALMGMNCDFWRSEMSQQRSHCGATATLGEDHCCMLSSEQCCFQF